MRDSVGVEILKNLKRLSTSHQIHLQWISSHDGVEDNEIAGTLDKAAASEASVPTAPLTYLEIFSRAKSQNKTTDLYIVKYSEGSEHYETCTECFSALPEHILTCLSLSWQDIIENPMLVLNLFRVHGLMNLIWVSAIHGDV
ncbi:RNase H domain-containing protein [Nephila pilipes]|uniref:RNase H domain-containing protein n=1 Tax=Nephila pilipes TaxID=299642 RepID=A0A8X6NEY4_NEPPI|nr:RNase H domain-containing protein [Nephila pilipes]